MRQENYEKNMQVKKTFDNQQKIQQNNVNNNEQKPEEKKDN